MKPLRVGCYLRKSTSEDRAADDELKSCAQQEANARRFAQKRGWKVVAVYRDDAHSGALVSRPDFDRLKADLGIPDGKPLRRAPDPASLPFDVLLCRDQSRLIRNADHVTLQIKRILRTGVRIAFYKTGEILSTDTFKPLVVGIQGAMDAEYREAARQNVREGMAEYARKGLSCGGCVLGFRAKPLIGTSVSGQPVRLATDLAIDREQARIVIRVFKLFVAGYSPREMGPMLPPKPLQGRRGSGRWSPSSIWDMLRNPRYAGELVYGRTRKQEDDYGGTYRIPQTDAEKIIRVTRQDLRIVPPTLWAAAQRRLKTIRKAYLRGRT